jgi:tetratricopeptide (TPR) repeat protein
MMTRYFLIAVCCVLLSSCVSKQETQKEIIQGMEEAIAQNTSDEFLRPLMANYMEYISAYPDDIQTPVYLYQSAVINYRVANYTEALENLHKIVQHHKTSHVYEQTLLLIGNIYFSKLGNRDQAQLAYQQYIDEYPEGEGIPVAKEAFLSPKELLKKRIKTSAQTIQELPNGQLPSRTQYVKLLMYYVQFIKEYKQSPFVATYSMKGARIAYQLGYYVVTAQFLELIRAEQKSFDYYSEALLMLAGIYDTNMRPYLKRRQIIDYRVYPKITKEYLREIDLSAEASKIYNQIIKDYPQHSTAQSAKDALVHLGKDADDVMDAFLEKNAAAQ